MGLFIVSTYRLAERQIYLLIDLVSIVDSSSFQEFSILSSILFAVHFNKYILVYGKGKYFHLLSICFARFLQHSLAIETMRDFATYSIPVAVEPQ
jgi:hypothetical protein